MIRFTLMEIPLLRTVVLYPVLSVLISSIVSIVALRNIPHKKKRFWSAFVCISYFLVTASQMQILKYSAWLPFEDDQSVIVCTGNVESVKACLYIPFYLSGSNGQTMHGFELTIDGERFLCLEAENLKAGDLVTLECYPRSRVVTSCILNVETATDVLPAPPILESEMNPSFWQREGVEYLFSGVAVSIMVLLSHFKTRSTGYAIVVPGVVAYRNGTDLYFTTILGVFLLHMTIPVFRPLNFGQLSLIPAITLIVCRCPVTYVIDDFEVSKYLFGCILIKSVKREDVTRVSYYKSLFGDLAVLVLHGVEHLKYATFFEMIWHCIKHRKDIVFLPIKPGQTENALSQLKFAFPMPINIRWSILSEFPLYYK